LRTLPLSVRTRWAPIRSISHNWREYCS
jgi:hypothetical protein